MLSSFSRTFSLNKATPKNMTFNELLKVVSSKKSPTIRIDSRLVGAGDIFAAIKGTACDGYDFIDKAIKDGAKYIVTDRPFRSTDAEIVVVENSVEAAAALAQTAGGNPAFEAD